MAQNTNLNIAPYFDDFDKSKGFLKVLFKPGFPVQARELTTLQTLLQDQIDTFGQGVYKEGSMVVPGGITLNKKVPCILIQNNYLNLDVENYRSSLDGKIIKGSTSGVRARILFSVNATTSTRGNITFYLNYLQKAEDNVTNTFSAGETFVCEEDITYASTTIASGTPLAQLLNSAATSVGSTASVGQGVFFARGYFVNVAEQTIILDQYGTEPSYKVGLKVEERIVTADEDASLYDNAIGSTNFSAPGADRFKISLTLVKKLITAPNSADFIELLRTNTGKVEKKVERSDLGFINEILATRTKEESGDYYVKKFEVDARENLDDGFNNGIYQSNETTSDGNTPSESKLAIQLSAGCAYVQGFRTERIAATYKDVEKPRTFDTELNKTVTSDFGNFVLMTNLFEAPELYETVEFQSQLTATPGTAAGTTIGTAKIANFAFESGNFVPANTDTVYRANLLDVDFKVQINLTSGVTGSPSVGDFVVGVTSGATGLYDSQGGSNQTQFLNTVNGTFQTGEVLKYNNANGATFGTISSINTYGFGHVKQYKFTSGGGTADAVLDVRVALPGSGSIMSGAGGGTSGTITSTLSNFKSQLRIGDIVGFSNNGATHIARVTSVDDNFNFGVERLGSTTLANGNVIGSIIRTRPELKEGEKKKLLTPLGYAAVKSADNDGVINPSGRFRISVPPKSVSGGNVSVQAGSNLKWVNGANNDDFIVIATAGSAAGQIFSYDATGSNGFTISSSTANVDTLDLGSLSGVTQAMFIGTVTSSNRGDKTKSTERMKVLVINDSLGSNNGLTQVTSGYGSRVEDASISFGCADVFKIKGIFESTDTSAPEIPNFEYTNLLGDIAIDEVIIGDTSGSRARIVSNDGNKIYFIPIEDDRFTDGETITAPNATLQIKTGKIRLGSTNITDNYDLDDGQRDQFYDYSRLIRKPGVAEPTHKILVVFDRFLSSQGASPYTVDSYAESDYKIIPSYEGTELRDVLDFRPVVPQALSGSGSQASPFFLSSARFFDYGYRAFTNNQVGLPGISDTTTLSLQYYLPRIDKVFLDKDSIISIVKGAPSTRPQPPEDLEDAMLLATVTYVPYIFNVDDDVTIEETNFKRYTFRDIQVLEDRIKTLEFYTQLSLLESDTANMEIRDSSGLNRFKNGFIVDNFASLATADTLHPDYRVSTDFERGQMRPAHYTTQVPLQYSTASQNVQQNDEDIITLPYTSTVLVDQPYASAVENVNPFNVFTFSGDVELFPESDNWVDTKSLNPIKGPVVEGNFMTTIREYNADQNGFSPIHWNSWKTTWTGTDINKSVGAWRDTGGGKGRRQRQRRTITTTTTTTTKQSRTGIRYRVTPVIEQQSLGSKVVSVEHIQFMRSRNISFTVQKLKPRTKFFAFFDNIKVSKKLITPKIIGLVKDPSTDSKTNNIPFQIGETVFVKKKNGKFRFKARVSAPNENIQINPIDGTDISTTTDYTSNLTFINIDTKSLADQVKGNYYGSPKINDYLVGETSGAIAKVSNKDLITDKRGNLRGSFFIDAPSVEGNQKFKTGTKLFRLTDSETNSQVSGVSDSSGEAEFSSSGILQTTQETIISVRNAKITSEAQYDARTLTSVGRTRQDETRDIPPPPPPPEDDWCDPLAQSFLIEDATLEGGVFLTKIDIFFFTKDPEIPVSLDIRTMENGNPTQTILPFSKVVKQTEDVFISDDASKPTTFEFKAPVYIPLKREHCMVLTSDSNQYKVFISLLGQDAIDAAHIGEKISEQPYIGVLFKSQNASTWTPSQYEDLMFKIYRAVFTLPSTAAPSRLILENGEISESNGGFLNLRRNALRTTAGSDIIRVFHGNHGMQSPLNYVSVSGVVSEVAPTTINNNSGITTTTGTIKVTDLSKFHDNIGGSAISNSNPGFIRILGEEEDGSGDEIIAYSAVNTGTNEFTVATNGRNHSGTSGSSTGKAHSNGAVVECYNFDGIPLTKINKIHSSGLASINSPHSYTLQISGVNAGVGIQGGGANIVASQNIAWDVLTPQIQSHVEPGTSIVARVQGTSGTSCGPFPAGFNAETSFVKDSDFQEITIGEENYFPATKLVANQINEINRMNSVKSLTLELNLFSEVKHLSPVIDLTRCDVITTANIINNVEPTQGVGGECAGNYITKVARLEKSATGLKVMLACNSWSESKIVVMYKLIPVGYVDSLDELPFQFFNTTGRPDTGELIPNNDLTTFTDYTYTIEDVDEFDGFQIKVSLLNSNQPYIPRVKDLRGIALA